VTGAYKVVPSEVMNEMRTLTATLAILNQRRNLSVMDSRVSQGRVSATS
jgi:hypothetical protein